MVQSHGHMGLHGIGEDADGAWKYQVRVSLTEDFAAAVRRRAARGYAKKMAIDAISDYFTLSIRKTPERKLEETLDKLGMRLKNQFDAFAGYCADVEAKGGPANEEEAVLYNWTKATIEKSGKKEQYATRFTAYEGDAQIYDKDLAEKLVAALEPFKEKGLITKINMIDSNPANNPQAPAKFTK